MTKKIVKRTDANNEILYFYTHSDAVDVGEGNATTSLTNALNNKANTSDVQALSDDALRKSPQSLSSQEKEQVHNNLSTESFIDDRAVRYDDAQVLGPEEKTQALTNLGLNGVDAEPTKNSQKMVRSGGVAEAIDNVQYARFDGIQETSVTLNTTTTATGNGSVLFYVPNNAFIYKVGNTYYTLWNNANRLTNGFYNDGESTPHALTTKIFINTTNGLPYSFDGTNFTTVAIDEEPTAGSKNLIESGGVREAIAESERSMGIYTLDTEGEDFSIRDKSGHSVVVFNNGGIKTKKFDSFLTPYVKEVQEVRAEFIISDPNNNAALVVNGGHILTKFFSSEHLSTTRVRGKRISIVGDSISTFQGYIPAGYATYYPQGTLVSVEQMWWKKVINRLGLVLGSNCSWSGCRLIGNASSTTNASCACSNKRIADLAANGMPDIIVCYVGINDLQKQFHASIGDVTSKDLWQPNNIDSTTISQGYSMLLSKLVTTYPLAKIFCCTLFANASVDGDVARDADGVYPTLNANGVYLEDVNKKIRELAQGYGVHLIDLACCGIHWGNIAQVTVDGITHPNELGQSMMADMIANDILKTF